MSSLGIDGIPTVAITSVSLLSSAMVIGLGIVALPYYFFRTRGLRRGALATLFFLLIVTSYSVLSNYLGQRAVFALRT